MAIFKGQKEKLMMDGPENLNRLVLGAEIVGDLTTQTSVRLDGKITGNLNCGGKLVLGNTGVIKGNVECLQAEIEGTIEGDITIHERLVLRASAIVQGAIFSPKIMIEDGAVFNGNCSMTSQPSETSSDKNKQNKTTPNGNVVSNDVVY